LSLYFIQNFANEHGITHLETSAKEATNVHEAFEIMTSHMITELKSSNYKKEEEQYNSIILSRAVLPYRSWHDYLTSWCSIA